MCEHSGGLGQLGWWESDLLYGFSLQCCMLCPLFAPLSTHTCTLSAAALWGSYKGVTHFHSSWRDLTFGKCTLEFEEGSCVLCSGTTGESIPVLLCVASCWSAECVCVWVVG